MTKKEKVIVKKAIADIMGENGDFNGAIYQLCKLVDIKYPAGNIKKKLKPIDLYDLTKSSACGGM